jgi:hypothetical protein
MKLAIATPFYSLYGFTPYIESLMKTVKMLKDAGIDWEFLDKCGDSFIDRARNCLVAQFMATDATDLLFIDSDISWDSMGLLHLLRSPMELTGGAYPFKNQWDRFTECIIYDKDHAPVQDGETGLIETDWLPAGFMRIKRSCIEKLIEAYKSDFFFTLEGEALDTNKVHNLFECKIVNSQRQSEDVTFCKKWQAIGGKCWLEPRISFGHSALNTFTGNLHEHLLELTGKGQWFH